MLLAVAQLKQIGLKLSLVSLSVTTASPVPAAMVSTLLHHNMTPHQQ